MKRQKEKKNMTSALPTTYQIKQNSTIRPTGEIIPEPDDFNSGKRQDKDITAINRQVIKDNGQQNKQIKTSTIESKEIPISERIGLPFNNYAPTSFQQQLPNQPSISVRTKTVKPKTINSLTGKST